MSSSSTIGSVLDALRLKVDKNGFIISDNNKANGFVGIHYHHTCFN